jgi:hypothetical protein
MLGEPSGGGRTARQPSRQLCLIVGGTPRISRGVRAPLLDCQNGLRTLPDHGRWIAVGCRLHRICSAKKRAALGGADLDQHQISSGKTVHGRSIKLVAGFQA